MSDARKFLTIPSREALFAEAQNDRSTEETCSPAADDEGDDEEAEDVARLMPRSSPVPRKRGLSILDETAEYLKIRLAMASRRVSFADTSGGDLVEVKEFVAFESDEDSESASERRETPRDGGSDGGSGGQVVYKVQADFEVPSRPALLDAVRANKVEVESVSIAEDEPLTFTGLVRVLNIAFHKAVYVRFTMNCWNSFFDVRADYVHGSNDVETDQFSFKLSFAKPYLYSGARIEFVVRFETPEGDYWANNAGRNYSVSLSLTQPQDTPQPRDAAGEKRRGILKASSYRWALTVVTQGEALSSAADQQATFNETRKAKMNVRPESAALCPQIVHPEIDIEVTDFLFLHSCFETVCFLYVGFWWNDHYTRHYCNDPLTTQPQVEPHQAPNLRKETEVPPDTFPEHSSLASVMDISCGSSVTLFPSSVETCTSSIFSSLPESSFQGMEFVTQTTIANKVPLEPHTILPPSLDVPEAYEETQTLDTEMVTEERDEMSTMIQSQHITSSSDLHLSEVDSLHAADSRIHIRHGYHSNYQDAKSEATSVHEMQTPFSCLPEELGKLSDQDKHSPTEETLVKVAESSKNVENVQAVGEELFGKLDTPVTTSEKDDLMCLSQAVPITELLSFAKRDPAFAIDEPTAICSKGLHSTRQLAGIMNVTPCAKEDQGSFRQLYDTLGTTESPDVATSVLTSAAATVSTKMSTSDTQSKNILEACEVTLSHSNEPTDITSLVMESLQKEEVSFEQQQPVMALLTSHRAECETAVVHALATAFVTFVFAVCFVTVIINPNIFFIIGLYLLL
ncbi:protein phosphatase 1 regulatory subunit 3A-like [Arapaima gigas]